MNSNQKLPEITITYLIVNFTALISTTQVSFFSMEKVLIFSVTELPKYQILYSFERLYRSFHYKRDILSCICIVPEI